MKVLHVVTDDNRRGAQIFARDLNASLSARPGVRSAVVALTTGEVGGLGFECLGPRRLHLRSLQRLRQRMRQADVTVAHGSSTVLACAIAGLGLRKPYVVRQISETAFWVNTWARRTRVRFYLARASAIVALSPSAAADLVEIVGVSGEKITVIPNGVPVGGFSPPDARAKRAAQLALGLDPDSCTIVVTSALVPEKGVDNVIRAVAEVPGAQLLIAGDGPERASLESLADSVAGGRVEFLGSVDSMKSVYDAADVLVLASKGGDSMPAVLIEAGFCGLVTVATDVGAIAETIDHSRTGLIVPVDDQEALTNALRLLCAEPETRSSLGIQARARCYERFEIQVVAESWLGLLQRVTGLSPRNTRRG